MNYEPVKVFAILVSLSLSISDLAHAGTVPPYDTPILGTVALSPGFSEEGALRYEITLDGNEPVKDRLKHRCGSRTTVKPTITFKLEESIPKLFFLGKPRKGRAKLVFNMALAIRTPDGAIVCAEPDGEGEVQATIDSAAAGLYQVWAAYDANLFKESKYYYLEVSE